MDFIKIMIINWIYRALYKTKEKVHYREILIKFQKVYSKSVTFGSLELSFYFEPSAAIWWLINGHQTLPDWLNLRCACL